jgi:hypothetical protein
MKLATLYLYLINGVSYDKFVAWLNRSEKGEEPRAVSKIIVRILLFLWTIITDWSGQSKNLSNVHGLLESLQNFLQHSNHFIKKASWGPSYFTVGWSKFVGDFLQISSATLNIQTNQKTEVQNNQCNVSAKSL